VPLNRKTAKGKIGGGRGSEFVVSKRKKEKRDKRKKEKRKKGKRPFQVLLCPETATLCSTGKEFHLSVLCLLESEKLELLVFFFLLRSNWGLPSIFAVLATRAILLVALHF